MTTMTSTPTELGSHRGTLWRGVYRLADPKITLASVASLIVGTAFAAARGPLSPGWLALTVLGIFCIEAAKNASGEIFDWDSGTDEEVAPDERTPFSGGKRVIVDRLMTRTQTAAAAAVFYALGGAAGLLIVVFREPAVLWLGLGGAALAFFYHAPPLKLSYRGWGEVAVALCYGPVIATGAFLVQRGTLDAAVVLASIPLGMAIMAFLWINEFPDRRADEAAGKRTLVVRLGQRRAASGFAVIVAIAYALVLALPALGLPFTAWLGCLGLPFGVAAARRLATFARAAGGAQMQAIVPAQAWTLLSFLLMAIGLGAGTLLGGA